MECIKFYDFNDDDAFRLNPEGCFEIIFQLGNTFHNNTSGTEGWVTRPNNFIGGLHSKSYEVRSEDKTGKLISIQFKKGAAQHFIPEKLSAFKNKTIDVDSIYTKSMLSPLEELGKRRTSIQNTSAIDRFLSKVFREQNTSQIDHALKLILNSHGQISISDIAGQVALSEAHLRKKFNETIGISPKDYSKIVRINSALRTLEASPTQKLSDLAYDLGYFDQAHFIKDFKSVTKASPKNYKRTS